MALTLFHFSCNSSNRGNQNIIGFINFVSAPGAEKNLPKSTDPPGITPSEIPKTPAPLSKPDIIVLYPAVRITRVTLGLVKAYFKFVLLNIGGRPANTVKTDWVIRDNGDIITNPDDWQKTINQPPWPPFDLAPEKLVTFSYGPDIGGRGIGTGTLELGLTITYTDPATGELLKKDYKGFVDYSVPKEGDSKGYLLSPSPT